MISVCIATYNGEKYIRRQIESIISQLSSEDEIIISDDNSTDGTIDVIKNMNSSMIKIYLNDGIKGYTSNFENSLRKSSGDYIFLSDQDDVWTENKISKCISYLKEYDMVVSDAFVTNSNLEVINASYYEMRKIRRTFIGNIIKFSYLGCCLSFKREVLDKALPFPKNHTLCTHDNWLFIVAQAFKNVNIINDKLVYYRRHENTASSGGTIDSTTLFFKIHYRLYLIGHLLRRAISLF